MNTYTELDVDGYERVVKCVNKDVGLRAWIAIHSTKLGPSLGGCRMWNYDTENEALTDVLRLSKGMTYKAALSGLSLGGGKSVIWGDSTTHKTPELLEAMGEFVEYVGGDYIIAEDVGTSVNDIVTMRKKTDYTVSKVAGDPGPFTAQGVFVGIKAACMHKYGTDDLSDVSVAIQGAGSVGLALAKKLLKSGALKVVVSDINESALKKASEIGAFALPEWKSGGLISHRCDVFAPCALGGIINEQTLGAMRFDIIAGSANNQLLLPEHGERLHEMGILYAPDYVINAGGVIMVGGDRVDGSFDKKAALKQVNNIYNTLTEIFEESKATDVATHIIADKLAERRLA